MTDEFKTTPFDHQLKDYLATREKPAWAQFHEMGTGKSKIIVDTIAYLYRNKEIDAALIVAPGTVHQNWRTDELPVHLADDVAERTLCVSFLNDRKTTKWHKKEISEALAHKGLLIVTMAYSAFMTPEGKALAWALMARNLMMVLDESGEIKNPTAHRTIAFIKASHYPKYKRVLDGTPVAQSPFDVYSPIQFLDPDYWLQYRIPNSHVFEYRYGEFQKIQAPPPGADGKRKRQQKFCIGYQRLDELYDRLQPISSRVLKADVLDLPERLYSKQRFEMTPPQRKIYEQVKTEYRTELNGYEWDADLTIVRQLRLQQITCGYLPTPEEEGEYAEPFQLIDPDHNPRLDLLIDLIERAPYQVIVWARFRMDIDMIMARLGNDAVRLDGRLKAHEREESKRIFKEGGAKTMAANPAVGATGLTMNNAKGMFFYSNSFKPRDRMQAEDRNHRIGQDVSVLVTDLMAVNSIDYHIVASLKKKRHISSRVMGDTEPEWL